MLIEMFLTITGEGIACNIINTGKDFPTDINPNCFSLFLKKIAISDIFYQEWQSFILLA